MEKGLITVKTSSLSVMKNSSPNNRVIHGQRPWPLRPAQGRGTSHRTDRCFSRGDCFAGTCRMAEQTIAHVSESLSPVAFTYLSNLLRLTEHMWRESVLLLRYSLG